MSVYEEIKNTVSKILGLYHAFIELHDRDRALASEMEDYARQNEKYGLYYQKMVDQSPDSVRKYFGHIEALIKLSPALNLCIKDHTQQLEESTHEINILTVALNQINEFISNGLEDVSQEKLKDFQKEENKRADGLLEIFPVLEKNHNSISLRFNTIKRELGHYPTPVLE
jgi:hypothetical protein